jgi:hypothetical protein
MAITSSRDCINKRESSGLLRRLHPCLVRTQFTKHRIGISNWQSVRERSGRDWPEAIIQESFELGLATPGDSISGFNSR